MYEARKYHNVEETNIIYNFSCMVHFKLVSLDVSEIKSGLEPQRLPFIFFHLAKFDIVHPCRLGTPEVCALRVCTPVPHG